MSVLPLLLPRDSFSPPCLCLALASALLSLFFVSPSSESFPCLYLPLSLSVFSFCSCCSGGKKSQHTLLKPVVSFLIFFPPPPPPLILHSHHCNQDQHTPLLCSDFQPPPPLILSALSPRQNRQREREREGVGGGESDKPAENCPSNGSLYVREGRCSHQRIHTPTQRHLASVYVHPLAFPALFHFLPPSLSLPDRRINTPTHKRQPNPVLNLDFFFPYIFSLMPHPGLFWVVGMFLWAHATGNLSHLTGPTSLKWRKSGPRRDFRWVCSLMEKKVHLMRMLFCRVWVVHRDW